VITAKNIEIGSLINPGAPAFTIGTEDNIKVKLDVNSDNITYLKLGQEAQISK
jgi:multidrug resistance efflux pump